MNERVKTTVKLSRFELQVFVTTKKNDTTIEVVGDTYNVNKALRFREAGFVWNRFGEFWMMTVKHSLTAEQVAAWLEASWAAKSWKPLVVAPAAPAADAAAIDLPADLPVRLLPHQAEAVRKIVEAQTAGHRGFLLADAPRVGKTYAILAALRLIGKPALVLSPASVVGMWRRELERWGIAGTAMSYETFRSRGHDGDAAVVVLDEAHKVKNSRAAVTKKVQSFCSGRFVIAATGTPFQNSPLEFQTVLKIAGLPYDNIIRNGMRVERNRWGGVEAYWITSRLSEVRARLEASPQYLRRELAQVAQYLPSVSRQTLEAEGAAWAKVLKRVDEELMRLEDQYRESGDEAKAEKVAAVRSGVFGVEDIGALFPIMSTLRSLLGEAKISFVAEVVSDLAEQGEPFLVFAHHETVRAALRETLTTLDIPYGEIAGDTPQAQRSSIADAFQRGELRALILSTRAAGEGLTLSRATAAVFAELDWNPAVLTQAENRLLNVAEGGNKMVYYVVAPHALERRMVQLINSKAADAVGVYAAAGSIATVSDPVGVVSADDDDDDDDPTPTPTPTAAPSDEPASDAPAAAPADAPALSDWWGVGEPSGWYVGAEDASTTAPEPASLPTPELPLWGAEPELWAGLPANAGADYIPPRIVREGVRGQGWKKGAAAPTTLRVKQISSSMWAVYVGQKEVHVGSEADAIAYLRSALPTLSLRKPGRDTIAFLERHKLLELHPNPNRPRGRKAAYRSVDVLPPREERVGFSEIAAVMGQSPFTSPLELWRVKVGLDEPKPETFAMRWGKETEKIALRFFCEQAGATQVKRHIKAADGALAGEVDAIAKVGGEWCVVEIKVASGKHAHHAYRLQVNAQLGALGLRKGFIFTVFGTHADTEEVLFDPDLYAQQKAAAEAFMEAVRSNTPPVPAEMLEARDAGLDELDLSVGEGESEAAALLADIAELERQIKPLEEQYSELKDKLKLAMLTTGLRTIKTGFALAELKEVQSERLDTKALRQAHPDIAAQFVKQTSYTQLKLKLY